MKECVKCLKLAKLNIHGVCAKCEGADLQQMLDEQELYYYYTNNQN